jgi:hypothetical protein
VEWHCCSALFVIARQSTCEPQREERRPGSRPTTESASVSNGAPIRIAASNAGATNNARLDPKRRQRLGSIGSAGRKAIQTAQRPSGVWASPVSRHVPSMSRNRSPIIDPPLFAKRLATRHSRGTRHSYRKAVIGSIRVAPRATGTTDNVQATSRHISGAATLQRSDGFTPDSRVVMSRAAAIPPVRPTLRPSASPS